MTRALRRCLDAGKIRVAAYSGDGAALRHAATPRSIASAGEVAHSAGEGLRNTGKVPAFGGLQASVSLCDQQALDVFAIARAQGVGTIAKRSLAGRPWTGRAGGDAVHDEYRRRFEALRAELPADVDDWDEFALRFAAFAPGVDCVIVGGTSAAHVDRNVAAVARGPLVPREHAAVSSAFSASGRAWEGLV